MTISDTREAFHSNYTTQYEFCPWHDCGYQCEYPKYSSYASNQASDNNNQAQPTSSTPISTSTPTILGIPIDPSVAKISIVGYNRAPDGSEHVDTINVDMNPTREQCFYCKTWFTDYEQLKRHWAAISFKCSRCGDLEEFQWCGGTTTHYMGCERHKLCFTTERNMLKHFKEVGHHRCYWKKGEKCTSKFVEGNWSATRIETHIRRDH
jgi:hypothetical protein